MSNAQPAQHATTDVVVTTAPGAAVSVSAHYKTTTTTHDGNADGAGQASVAFDVGGAPTGYPVLIDVTVSASGHSGTCATSFTPS